MRMQVTTVHCKSALTSSKLLGYRYALNPYRGCEHACAYCYAPYVLHEDREWGEFVDVKLNIPSVLARELRRREKGVIGISTVTDPYQPAEKRYELTRRCLEVLCRHSFPISIQTKSSLVLRDRELIRSAPTMDVGVTITTIDDGDRRRYEPRASPVDARLQTLEELAEDGIKTWAFVGPVMPYITDRHLEELFSELSRTGVRQVFVDKLNLKKGMRQKLLRFIAREFPEHLEGYEHLSGSYFQEKKAEIARLGRGAGLKVEFCY